MESNVQIYGTTKLKNIMAFIINKQSTRYGKTRELYYLVESYRENGKVKRRTLLKLGANNKLSDMLTLLKRKESDLVARIALSEKKLSLLPDSSAEARQRVIKFSEWLKALLQDCKNTQNKIKSFM